MIFILSRVNHHIDHAEEFMAILPIFYDVFSLKYN